MSAKSEADPQLGRTLGGQYRIEALLGAGGMGRVYRGRQLSVNRPVAIKLIAGSAPHPPEWVSRFRREAEATASLSHPNSVRLFDFGVTESEELFMVMELLEGIDLAHQLAAHGALPVVTALSVMRQVLLALCEAHALGITHRDIKPDNIFLASVRGADVVAKVMDFGIAGLAQAQHKSRLTGTGVIIGTPLYMSPEQAQGIPVDNKSDLYSLGVVLFEMLTGRPVFESNTAVTLLLAHVSRPPRRLDEVGMQLREQASLQALLDRLLAKDPALRPSAAEALDSVTALAAKLGIAGATGSMRAPPPLPAARTTDEPADAQAFQGARATGAHTHAPLRPWVILLSAGLVLTATTALALRWVPTLIEAAQPKAAETQRAAATTPEPELRTVLIESQPSGAQVLLDSDKIGTTPYQLQLRRDTEISVARDGYARQLLTVAHDARSPLLVKLVPRPDPKLSTAASERSGPLFFSFKQANSARIEPRTTRTDKRPETRRAPEPRERDDDALRAPPAQAPAFEPSVLVTRDPEELRPDAPLPAAEPAQRGPARERATGAQYDSADRDPDERRPGAPLAAAEGAQPSPTRERSLHPDQTGALYDSPDRDPDERRPDAPLSAAEAAQRGSARDDERDDRSERSSHTSQPTAAEGKRSEAVQEDEVSEIALDDDERAHVSRHYGLRAFGRAIARAVGKLLIPYPSRARRAALAEMPLQYFSFREARAAYKHREIDETGFQEAVWQLRERRRRKITAERDRYARGELTQGQYEAQMDRIWDEFWGRR